MARDFNGTSDRIYRSESFFGNPLTMACWFYADNNTAAQALLSWNQAGSSAHYHTLLTRGSAAGDPVALGSVDGGALEYANTSTGYSTGVWSHACGVVASTTDRKAYLDGGGVGTNTVARNPASLAEINIGALRHVGGVGSFFDGYIAEVGFWNAALSADEVAALAKGYPPTKVRPENLVMYLPLVRDVMELGGASFNTSGTAAAPHPRVIY